MRLKQLRLHDFRSYRHIVLKPSPGITVIEGENGVGKTNLLEAMHLCCLGKSHRTAFDRDMIRYGCDTCGVHAIVERKITEAEVGVRLYAQAKKRKTVFVNGKTASRLGELMGHMACVMFAPEDLLLARGAPQLRRQFLDMLLSQHNPAFFYAIQQYNNILKQRNALLKVISKSGRGIEQLEDWDIQLSEAAGPVVRARRDTAMSLNRFAAEDYVTISGRKNENFTLSYQGPLSQSINPEEDMKKALEMGRDEDLRQMATQTGPHRDDLLLHLSGRELRSFASQGQIRTAVLSMRLAQMDLFTRVFDEAPLLLLDDVLSELDHFRRSRLVERLYRIQTFITCTEIEALGSVKADCVLRICDGAAQEQ